MSNDTPALGRLDRVHLIRSDAEIESMLEAEVPAAAPGARGRGPVAGCHRPVGRHRLVGGDGACRPCARPAERDRRADALAAHRAGASRRRSRVAPRQHGSRAENMLTISIEPLLDGLEQVRPGVARGRAAVRQRQRPGADDRALRRRPDSYDALVLGTENRSEYLPRLLHALRRRGVGHRADPRPVQDRGADRGPPARPAGVGDRQAPDRRPVGRPDRRGGAGVQLPRRRPGDGRDAGARHGRRRGIASAPECRPTSPSRIDERVRSVAWKHVVPHAL